MDSSSSHSAPSSPKTPQAKLGYVGSKSKELGIHFDKDLILKADILDLKKQLDKKLAKFLSLYAPLPNASVTSYGPSHLRLSFSPSSAWLVSLLWKRIRLKQDKSEQKRTKPDKNGKRGEAEKSQKQLQWIEQEKPKKTQK
nr:protein kinase superfamily protein [Tanacetum cinerariifolium]